jgi:hypothetical protein
VQIWSVGETKASAILILKKYPVGGLLSAVCLVGSSREKSWQNATHTALCKKTEPIMKITAKASLFLTSDFSNAMVFLANVDRFMVRRESVNGCHFWVKKVLKKGV